MSSWIYNKTDYPLCFQTHIEKGRDILEEASMLTQSEEFGQVEGIKDVAGQLKSRMKGFTCHLEQIRNRIEDNAKCYHLLDKVRDKKN